MGCINPERSEEERDFHIKGAMPVASRLTLWVLVSFYENHRRNEKVKADDRQGHFHLGDSAILSPYALRALINAPSGALRDSTRNLFNRILALFTPESPPSAILCNETALELSLSADSFSGPLTHLLSTASLKQFLKNRVPVSGQIIQRLQISMNCSIYRSLRVTN